MACARLRLWPGVSKTGPWLGAARQGPTWNGTAMEETDMTKYTTAVREEIIEEYREATGREYVIASEFLKYVQDAGPSHPAYDWFEWDDTIAALWRI